MQAKPSEHSPVPSPQASPFLSSETITLRTLPRTYSESLTYFSDSHKAFSRLTTCLIIYSLEVNIVERIVWMCLESLTFYFG